MWNFIHTDSDFSSSNNWTDFGAFDSNQKNMYLKKKKTNLEQT